MLLSAHSPSHLFGWMKNWWTEQQRKVKMNGEGKAQEIYDDSPSTTTRRRHMKKTFPFSPSHQSHRTHISCMYGIIAIRGRDKIKAKKERKEEKSSSTLHRLSQPYLIISPFLAVRHIEWEGWKTHFTIFFHSLKRNDAKNCVLFLNSRVAHVRVWDFTHDVYNQ